MNVLSLFDGMSCGQIALERAGLHVDNYFASEIDKYTIKVTTANYLNTKHIGSIVTVKGKDLPKIDLLIGGSPCQGFSFSGKNLNFDDPRSVLFFEFVRLLKETKPEYFLLENVRMKKESQNVISDCLGVFPVEINSARFSAQHRRRLYWTNIKINKLPNNSLIVRDILENKVDVKYHINYFKKRTITYNKHIHLPLFDNCIEVRNWGYIKTNAQGNWVYSKDYKSITLTANGGGLGRHTGLYKIEDVIRKLTPKECERLQTVPEGYTDKNISNAQRYRMLGNGWTVDVIVHILKGIKEGKKISVKSKRQI